MIILNTCRGLPPAPTMPATTSAAVFGLAETCLGCAASRRVIVLRCRKFLACRRIVILGTIFLPATPAPGLAAAHTYLEISLEVEAARKNVVARGVFQAPALTPGALFGVLGAGLGHLYIRIKYSSHIQRHIGFTLQSLYRAGFHE